MRVLIVDDDEDVVFSLHTILCAKGVDVVGTGTDGSEAVKLYEELQPDILLMDIQMKPMNGLDAARTIREMKRRDARRVPIIAMSANAFAEDRKRAFDAGMNEHIAKPIDVEKLGAVILSVLKKQESLQTGKNNIRNGY